MKSHPVYVNGIKHKNIPDALLTTGGCENSLRKALSCELPYRGYVVSYDPPEEDDHPLVWVPGSPLISKIKVYP